MVELNDKSLSQQSYTKNLAQIEIIRIKMQHQLLGFFRSKYVYTCDRLFFF